LRRRQRCRAGRLRGGIREVSFQHVPARRAAAITIQRDGYAIEDQKWPQGIGNGPQQVVEVASALHGLKDAQGRDCSMV
jgi:hypothetical protein